MCCQKTNDFGNVPYAPDQVNWEKTHMNNFTCSINTRIRSFYFNLFHRAIALNDFVYKIKRKDSPNCSFCKNYPETYIHLFIEGHVAQPIWEEVIKVINQKNMISKTSVFEKMFGIDNDNMLTYLFLLLKYYIYVCKFQSKLPNYEGYKAYIAINKDLEYRIAKKTNKLPLHFRKWRFDM